MISSEVQRTLVKSPPELWSELSDPDALARHLGELGEIKITRTEPEKLVAWEAQGTTGTVAIKASGWGTKVTLTVHHEPPAPAVDEPEESEQSAAPESSDAADSTSGANEAVSTEPKPAPATEAARRAAGWPETDEQGGPAIESDLRAAEAGAQISEHAPWHLEKAEHALRALGVAEPPPEPAPEPRRGFFARLFGSRRKRPDTAEAIPQQPDTDLAPDTEVVPDALAETATPETIEPDPIALTEPAPEPDDSAVANTEAAESSDLAAELKAAEEIAAEQVEAVLTSMLDRLGAAHHRPFSRA